MELRVRRIRIHKITTASLVGTFGVLLFLFCLGWEKLVIVSKEDTSQQEEAQLPEIGDGALVSGGGEENYLKHAVDEDAGQGERQRF